MQAMNYRWSVHGIVPTDIVSWHMYDAWDKKKVVYDFSVLNIYPTCAFTDLVI